MKTRVLLVDDEPEVMRALARLLTRRGYEVRAASSGGEALAHLDGFDPQVVLSDYRMPGMTGGELLEKVFERRPEIVRVIVSGCAEVQQIIESMPNGSSCRFFSKPWDDAELLACLADAPRPK